jgi:hypothetical protein
MTYINKIIYDVQGNTYQSFTLEKSSVWVLGGAAMFSPRGSLGGEPWVFHYLYFFPKLRLTSFSWKVEKIITLLL